MVAKKSEPSINVDAIAKREQNIRMLNANAYRPDPGDTLTAHLVGLRKGGLNSEYGIYPVLYFRRAEGFPFPKDQHGEDQEFVALHAYHSIIKDRLVELKPRPADEPLMTVHYAGKVLFGVTKGSGEDAVYVELKGKNDYEKYTVFMGDGTEIEAMDEWDWSDDDVADES